MYRFLAPLGMTAACRFLAALGMTLVAQVLTAQTPRGTVSDSAGGQPIPGAVVSLIDSSGTTIARFITNARGEYRFPGFTLGARMRIVRMGYRPRDVRLPPPAPGSDEPIAVRMLAIPMLLDQVSAIANSSCPRRSDRAAAFALLEQARAGLLNAVVARETHPATMTVLPYSRLLYGRRDSIVRQTVQMKFGDSVIKSFYAVRSAAEFVREGFVKDSGQVRLYYGPDVDVLLDQNFTAGYCFHIQDPNLARPSQVGLAFRPARRRNGRIDLDGTLWIDTLARKLVTLEYRFLGLPVWTDPVEPGGESSFWEVPNGVVFIDKWHLRLPGPERDTAYNQKGEMIVRIFYSVREVGGEVAAATWPDGSSYQGPLGILNSRVLTPLGQPMTGVTIRLNGTDYVTSPDSAGFLEMHNLLPGPYSAVAIHPDLVELGIALPTSLVFTAVRDSITQKPIVVPDPWDHVMKPCSKSPLDNTSRLKVFVQTPDKKGVPGAWWSISKAVGVPWERIIETGRTLADGSVVSCLILNTDDDLELSAWRTSDEQTILHYKVGRNENVYRITLPFRDPR